MARQSKADAEFSQQYPFLTDKERFLIGWPGYRTRPEKSGLAPVETQAELGHMQGLMLRWLFTGTFRTRNPVYQALMVLVGIWWSWPLVPILSAIASGDYYFLSLLVIVSPYLLAGVLLLYNAGNCIFGEQDWDDIAGDEE